MPVPDDERLALPVGQQALPWCVRVWVAGLHRPVEAGPRIRDMMARLGAPDATPCFEGLMFASRHGTTRRPAVGCVCRRQVSDDERMLPDTLGLAQECRLFEALLMLRDILTPQGARAALHGAERLGIGLARAGRFLPAPEAEAPRFAGAGPPLSSTPC